MQVRRWAAPLGAIIEDVDVRKVDDAAWQKLDELFCQYHVLVFPGQTLTPEEQMAFGRRWGPLVQHPYSAMREHPEIIELRNQGKRG